MRSPAERNSVLAYHEVMPESDYAYCVASRVFAEHLQLIHTLATSSGGQVQAQITFDDGEVSQLQNALPILASHGVSATYFVTPGLIGTAAKFLAWEQLRVLQAAGHSIQSHGWSHKFLTFCDDGELAHELTASKQALEEQLGRNVEEISIPGGRWDRRVLAACARAGYKRVYVSEPWIADEVHGVKVIGRFMVRRTTSRAELTRMIEQDPRALWKLKMRAQLKRSIVGLLGDGLYHRLWCRLTGYDEFEATRQELTPEARSK